jgi:hypothetical protein
MAEKPRVKAPKQRSTPRDEGSGRRRLLVTVGIVVAALAGAAFFFLGTGFVGGGGAGNEGAVRADLEDAGCTLQAVKAKEGRHSLGPDEIGKWNTDPPTNGPHFGFDQNSTQGTVIWGAYSEPIQLARVVHNLEHGGVYILYGDDVSDDVVEQLLEFYDDHQTGTVLAPLPKLGDKIALGAWVADDSGAAKGYLAKCTSFDQGAFSSFFTSFQFQGPERFPADSLLPGGS